MSSRVVAIIVANATCAVCARRDPHADAQARDRVEHGAGEIGERPAIGDGDRRVHGASAAEEARAIGLELDARRARRVAITCAPKSARSVDGARAAREDEPRNLRHELAADEEVRERRVREVCGRRRQRDLRVRRDLDLASLACRGCAASAAGSRRRPRPRRSLRASSRWCRPGGRCGRGPRGTRRRSAPARRRSAGSPADQTRPSPVSRR